MGGAARSAAAAVLLVAACGCTPLGSAPAVRQAIGGAGDGRVDLEFLPVGVWTDITPSEFAGRYLVVNVSAAHPGLLWLGAGENGLWRSSDAGRTWVQLGDPGGDTDPSDGQLSFLDNPQHVVIDPADADHLLATEGVNGDALGLWESHDGGSTWTMPDGFSAIAEQLDSYDVTELAVDPADFGHLLVSYHSDWSTTEEYTSGIIETRDGAATWTAHLPPEASWSVGTKGVHFLHDPATGQGDGDTWLVTDENDGFWRTTDAGATWEQVSDALSPHGIHGTYYSTTGALYAGAWYGVVMRSVDNGATWDPVEGLPDAHYITVGGDGERLYTRNVDDDAASSAYFVSAESDGTTWALDTESHGGPAGTPAEMAFDPVNRILYSANPLAGLWALRRA